MTLRSNFIIAPDRCIKLCLTIFCSFCLLGAKGQVYTQNIIGRILDADTKKPLFGAKLILLNTDPILGTSSNEEGYFSIKDVKVGRYDMRVSYPGYEDVHLNQIEVTSGKELILNLEMTEKVKEIEGVTVRVRRDKGKPLNEMATVSARTFNVEETQRYAASFNDPARMAVSFAGVNTSNDASNEIIVRGNSARGMLWRVEGIEIPNPNHFSNGEGGSGGGISILSSQILGSSDFFTGAFPAEYGNALSGVFDIRFRKGNYTKREYSVQLGILGLQSSFEGPFSKKYKGSYLINYRYSTLIFLNAIGLPVVDNALVPQFQDLSYNFNLPAGKLGTFSIWGLGGISTAGELAIKDSTTWEKRSDRFQDNNYQAVGASGITHTFTLKSNKTFLRSVAALSGDQTIYKMDSLDQYYLPKTAYTENMSYRTVRINSYLNHKFNSKHILRGGGIYSHYLYSVLTKGLDLSTGENGTFIDENGNTDLIQTYVQWKYRITPNLDLNSGFHQSYFLLNKRSAIEPRIGLQWRFIPRHSLNFGAGLHSRIEPISLYLARIYTDSLHYTQPNFDLGLTRSFHAVIGHDWTINESLRLKSEVYYQYLFDVPVDTTGGSNISILNASAGITRNAFQNLGFGRNYGLEVTLERFFASNYFFLFTGSLFESEYSVGDNRWFDTRFNANYMLNALGGYELHFGKSKKNSWGINTRVTWRGGNRYSPIDLNASLLNGYEVLYPNREYSLRVPDYFRADVSTNVRFNYKTWALTISTEIQNVTNRLNINRYYFDPYTKEIRSALMFGIMPVFNFKFEF